jgi:hypothetical protein
LLLAWWSLHQDVPPGQFTLNHQNNSKGVDVMAKCAEIPVNRIAPGEVVHTKVGLVVFGAWRSIGDSAEIRGVHAVTGKPVTVALASWHGVTLRCERG